MELLVWHAALGCDDEQASDAELRARVLFSYATGAPAGESESEQQLRALRLAQALLAFAQRLTTSESSEPAWLSVTLSRRRFFLQEVEPQIFMALVRCCCYCMEEGVERLADTGSSSSAGRAAGSGDRTCGSERVRGLSGEASAE